MPFGKANSSKHFCAWTDLWFSSFLHWFRRAFPFHAVLGSYVDDGFGGAGTQGKAQLMIDHLFKAGRATATLFNMVKTRGPARSLVILGLLYCSLTQSCRLGNKKKQKYLSRVDAMMVSVGTTSKLLEQLVGNLGFAAWVEPFTRPLLTFLSTHISRESPTAVIAITPLIMIALRIWRVVLVRNRGLPFRYVLASLPVVASPIFVDAASSHGVGGFHVKDYFALTHDELGHLIRRCPGWEAYPQVPIAWLELLAVCVAMHLFANRYPAHLIVLYSDNTNVVSWLGPRRSPHPVVCALVAAIERLKYQHLLKLSVRFIPSGKNRTADLLSRGVVPGWLQLRGSRVHPRMRELANSINRDNLVRLWTTTMRNSITIM